MNPSNDSSQLSNPSFSRAAGAPIYIAGKHDNIKEKNLAEFISSGDEILITDGTYPTPVMMRVVME